MARQNDHTRAEELISAYLDKRLSAEEKVFFERHIASCADCRAQLETTRSMVAALRAMPPVKAPRSFVLPRETARRSAAQPRRSFLTLYPALRLATVMAAVAFAVLFASDLLIARSGGGTARQSSLPAAAPVPLEAQAPTVSHEFAPAPEPTMAPMPTMTEAASDAATNSAGVGTEPPAGAPAPKAAVIETTTLTATMAMSVLAPTGTTTATAETAMRTQATVEATPEPAGTLHDQQGGAVSGLSAQSNFVAAQPAIDPLRIVEIALLVLAVVLGIATLIVRRKQV